MAGIRLDPSPVFLDRWFGLEQEDAVAVLRTLRRVTSLTWQQLYGDPGLRWEAIRSVRTGSGQRLYTFRVTRKIRIVGVREGDILRLISLHPDHDSAYQ
jgi:hypothetical protein